MVEILDSKLFFSLVAASITAFLGLVIFIHDRKSFTNRIFIVHSLIATIWALVNYQSVIAGLPTAIYWIRLVIFFASLHVILFYIFIKNFPNTNFVFKKREVMLIVIIVCILAFLTLTPFVFNHAVLDPSSNSIVPVPGALIPFFAITLVALVLTSYYTLIRRLLSHDEQNKTQLKLIGLGLSITYALLIGLVFLRVILFKDSTFVPYSSLFILPTFIGVAYGIMRYKVFNIKVIATEIIIFILLVLSLVNLITATNALTKTIGVMGVGFTLVTGVLLVRSVLREVKQREELEVLSKQLSEANEQLKQLDKARAEFISIASHQLRTPPATIKWYLGAILTGDFGALSDELKAAIERTNVTNNAQIHTIDDLLNASRIERGKLEFFFEKAKLEPIVLSLVEQLRPLAEMKKLKLEYTPPAAAMPDILLDQEKVRQVINNMIDNAIKYSKQGSIVVNLKQDQDNLVVSVKDNGKGIAPDEITSLFDKYSRGHDSVTHATGLGLGMYVAKVIVEQHHGKIWAESPGVGQGATFLFSLPIHTDLKPTTVDLAKSV